MRTLACASLIAILAAPSTMARTYAGCGDPPDVLENVEVRFVRARPDIGGKPTFAEFEVFNRRKTPVSFGGSSTVGGLVVLDYPGAFAQVRDNVGAWREAVFYAPGSFLASPEQVAVPAGEKRSFLASIKISAPPVLHIRLKVPLELRLLVSDVKTNGCVVSSAFRSL